MPKPRPIVPSPRLRGRDREGARNTDRAFSVAPSPTLPRKRGREQSDRPSKLAADALDGGAAGRELVLKPLEAAVEMIDAVDDGLALGRKRRNDERDRGTQIGGHDRRTLERAHALDGGAL